MPTPAPAVNHPAPGRLHDVIDRLTFHAARRAGLHHEAPAPPAFRTVLVCVDDSPEAAVAVEWAKALRDVLDARVHVVTVLPPLYAFEDVEGDLGAWFPMREGQEGLEAEARALVEEAAAAVGEADVHMARGAPVREIVHLAREIEADLVIVGPHARGRMERLMLGSVADGVKNHVEASVLIARTSPPPARVLIPTDGSWQSKMAASVGMRLVEDWDAHATLLHVVDPRDYAGEPDRHVLDETLRGIDAHSAVSYALDTGAPAQRIVEGALAREAGLLVLGSRGLGAFASLVLGSISNRVTHEAPCSVLVVKEPRR